MKHNIKRVIDGISRYMDAEIYSGMNDWQEFIARLFIGRLLENDDEIIDGLISNGFIRTFGIVDSEGMVDVDALAKDLKREIARKEKLSISIPMFGNMTFTPSDVDVLYRTITGEELTSNENY